MTAPVVHSTCEIETRRVSGVMAASNAASVRSSSPSSPASTNADLDAHPVAQRDQRAAAPGVLVGRRHGTATGPPVGEQRRGVHPVRRGVGQRHRADVGPEHGRHAGPRLGHPLQEFDEIVRVGPPDVAFASLRLGHRRGRLGGQRTDRSGVQVDPRREGRQRRPDRRELLGIRA